MFSTNSTQVYARSTEKMGLRVLRGANLIMRKEDGKEDYEEVTSKNL